MAIEAAAYRLFLSALDEPALVLDGRTIRLANAAAKRLFGSTIEQSDVRFAIRNPNALTYILPGRPGDVEVTGIGGFGRPWTLSIRELGDNTILLRFIDRSAAAAAERMRVDFVANASHELRTPLTAIVGYAETMADADELDRETLTNFSGTIRNEARRMLRIINDLMGLSRIEADRFVMPTDSIAIGDLVRTAVEHLQAAPANADSAIEVDIDPNIPPILGDRGQILQLCDNLLSNALRYGRGRNGEPVRVRVGRADGSVTLTVADSGQGIPTDHLPRLTERFYRVDAARSRDSGGTGLGLSIVKHIVERHRGTLEIDSVLGQGTTVKVTLPIARPQG